ncbi:MAG: ATP-binding protein involved in chromosome partitioning [Lentisphaeria bacterium]|jgi:ATP-binding protein involved in chromosome partitioning
MITEDVIKKLLEKISLPIFLGSTSIVDAVDSIDVNKDHIDIYLKLGFKAHSQERLIAVAIENGLDNVGISAVKVHVESEVMASAYLKREGQLSGVKNIVMVASGKGGVGKSTTAINLALALQAEGASVGILDADIYGPSMRTMLGIEAGLKPELVDGKFVQAIKRHGLKSMSIAYMSEEKTPMIWRGPMAVRALQQLLENTVWGELDYLILDMPPGTGDIHISMAQKVSVSAALVVTTPQDMAISDAKKGIEMFVKVGVPILGLVENMAKHMCSNCGFEESIFGSGGAQSLAEQYQLRVLGSMALCKKVREDTDAGVPTVVRDPGGKSTADYMTLANNVGYALWEQNKNAGPALQIEIVNS